MYVYTGVAKQYSTIPFGHYRVIVVYSFFDIFGATLKS